jgi:hypothetical protein
MTETASALSDRAGTPSLHVRRLPVRGGLLLLDTATNTLLAYNDVAGEVWDRIESGWSQPDIVAAIAELWGIAGPLAQRDVQAILDLWRDQALLVGERELARAPSITSAQPVAELGPAPPAWVCTIRGVPIAFSVAAELQTPIRALLRHLETPAARPQSRMEITRTPSGFLFCEDGRERLRSGDAAVVLGALYVAVLERIRPGVEWFALIHGAALARDGSGVALLGSSGSGKSTLGAALMREGFDFLSDDIVPLAAPDAAIVPWPLPLSLKPGSIDVLLPRIPELESAPRYRTKGVEARTLTPPQQAWDLEPVGLNILLFPRFVEGAAPQFRKLSPFEALERLLTDRVWLGDPITEERATAFLAWLERTPAHALVYGTLDDALGLVEGVMP